MILCTAAHSYPWPRSSADAPYPPDTDAPPISLRARLRGNPGLHVRDRSPAQATIGHNHNDVVRWTGIRPEIHADCNSVRGRYTMPEGADRSVTFPNKARCALFMTIKPVPAQWQPVRMCTLLH